MAVGSGCLCLTFLVAVPAWAGGASPFAAAFAPVAWSGRLPAR